MIYEIRHYLPGQTQAEVVTGWQSFTYWQRLNALQPLEALIMPHTNYWASALRDDSRLTISRYSTIVWHGHLIGDGWSEPREAPEGQAVRFQGLDLTEEAALPTILPRSHYYEPVIPGEYPDQTWIQDDEYWPGDAYRAPADDMLKWLVRTQMTTVQQYGPAGRGRDLITVEQDYSLGQVISARKIGGTVLEKLQEMADQYAIWWQFVPSETGARFYTGYPLWGRDRTAGDGVCILSTATGTLASIEVERNWANLRNVVYLAGQGITRKYAAREDSASIATYRRREVWRDIDQWNVGETAYNDAAYAELRKHRLQVVLSLVPAAGVLGTLCNLGDRVIVRTLRGSKPFEFAAVITGVQIIVDKEGLEHIGQVEATVD